MLYWQRQCGEYVLPSSTPLLIGDSKQAVALSSHSDEYLLQQSDVIDGEMTSIAVFQPSRWKHFKPFVVETTVWGSPIEDSAIFCHYRKSEGGQTKLIVADFRANVDHGQFCSIDFDIITPGTLSHDPTMRHEVEWTPGWWRTGVRKERLKFATVDDKDESHFQFSYKNGLNAVPSESIPEISASEHDLDNTVVTIDFWLQDDGSILRRQSTSHLATTAPATVLTP